MNDSDRLVSIIIPIYNVEQYLQECIDSVINQTYKNLEIILIDDGSPDECWKICDENAKKDKRIKVIHKKNGGLSSARNVGINIATGDYIIFVDSDDYLYNNAIEILCSHMKNDVDFINFSAINFEENKILPNDVVKYYLKKNIYSDEMKGYEALKILLENSDYKSPVQLYFFRTSFIKENRLFFHEGIIHEDEEFMIKSFIKANLIKIIPLVLYYHRIRNSSIMGRQITFKNSNGIFMGIKEIYGDYIVCDEIYKESYEYALYHLIKTYFYRLNCSLDKGKIETKKQTYEIKNTIKNNNFKYINKKLNKILKYYNIIGIIRKIGFDKKLKKFIKMMKSTKIAKKIKNLYLDDTSKTIIEGLNSVEEKRIIILCTPHNHSNRGDIAISLAQKEFIEKNLPEYKLIEVSTILCEYHSHRVSKLINDDDIICVCGGGWFGSFWRHNQIAAMNIIKKHKNNKIFVFPQTIYYSNNYNGRRQMNIDKKLYKKLNNFNLCVRDIESYNFVKKNKLINNKSNLIFLPDMVLSYTPKVDVTKKIKNRNVSVCFRNDMEQVLDFGIQNEIINILKEKYNFIQYISSNQINYKVDMRNREKTLNEFLKYIVNSDLIITDRLHCMIFAIITGTPCIAFDNKTGKVSGVYKWIKEKDYIKVVKNIEEFKYELKKIKNKKFKVDHKFYTELMYPIVKIIKEEY